MPKDEWSRKYLIFCVLQASYLVFVHDIHTPFLHVHPHTRCQRDCEADSLTLGSGKHSSLTGEDLYDTFKTISWVLLHTASCSVLIVQGVGEDLKKYRYTRLMKIIFHSKKRIIFFLKVDPPPTSSTTCEERKEKGQLINK